MALLYLLASSTQGRMDMADMVREVCGLLRTFSADFVAYHMAPAMLMPRPTTFQGANRKSPKATAPMKVIAMFLTLPATLVVSGSLNRVHTNVLWLIVSPSAHAASSVNCGAHTFLTMPTFTRPSMHRERVG